MYMCFSKTPGASPSGRRPAVRRRRPTARCSARASACWRCKRLADAERDGDRIYAVIRGDRLVQRRQGQEHLRPARRGPGGSLCGARTTTPECTPDTSSWSRRTAPGRRSATRPSWRRSTRCLASRRRRSGTWCALGAVKSQIGHTKAAAGAAGLIKAALALHHKVLPPTIKVDEPNRGDRLRGRPVLREHREPPVARIRSGRAPRRRSRAFGFGGTNFHFVLEEHARGGERPQVDVHRVARAHLWHAPDTGGAARGAGRRGRRAGRGRRSRPGTPGSRWSPPAPPTCAELRDMAVQELRASRRRRTSVAPAAACASAAGGRDRPGRCAVRRAGQPVRGHGPDRAVLALPPLRRRVRRRPTRQFEGVEPALPDRLPPAGVRPTPAAGSRRRRCAAPSTRSPPSARCRWASTGTWAGSAPPLTASSATASAS